jgi:hypothetical protein
MERKKASSIVKPEPQLAQLEPKAKRMKTDTNTSMDGLSQASNWSMYSN